MKKVLGGTDIPSESEIDVCEGKTGLALKECRYEVCMKGWVTADHTAKDNKDKLDSCYALSGLPQ